MQGDWPMKTSGHSPSVTSAPNALQPRNSQPKLRPVDNKKEDTDSPITTKLGLGSSLWGVTCYNSFAYKSEGIYFCRSHLHTKLKCFIWTKLTFVQQKINFCPTQDWVLFNKVHTSINEIECCSTKLKLLTHYIDIIMTAMTSQITSLTIVYSTVYSGADQRNHQSSASLAFVWGIHRSPVNSPHKGPVTRKMFPFDDVIMKIRNVTHRALY